MPVSSADLASYIGTTDDDAVASDLAVAMQSVDVLLGRATREVPDDLRDRLYLEAGQAFYDRRNATSSQSGQFAVLEGQMPVRAPRDPLQTVWPIIRRYVRPF